MFLLDVFNRCSSVKEKNNLVSEKVTNIYYLKNWRYDFFGKKIWGNALDLKSKKVQGIFEECLFWYYHFWLSAFLIFKEFFSE